MCSYEGEDDGDEEDFKLKEQLRRAARSGPCACVCMSAVRLARVWAGARRRRPRTSCIVFSQNAELQKQIEIMQDRHKLENTRLEGRVQVCALQSLEFQTAISFCIIVAVRY